jgi:uncharacterized integral membrane protein (TIGR00697 family)
MNTNVVKRVNSIKEWSPKNLYIVSSVFVAALLISNFAAQKMFSLGPFVFTAGVLVFPISYIFGDVLTEVYGFRRARKVIYLGFVLNIFMSLVLWISIQLPPASGWNLQNEYATINSVVPRMVLASMFAYLSGELVNSYVVSKLKVKTEGKHLFVRLIGSTFAGELVDSIVFAIIGFVGTLPFPVILTAIVSAWLVKTLYEILVYPLTVIVVNKLKRSEGVDHFDKEEKVDLLY